jgi:HEAT repeat protein
MRRQAGGWIGRGGRRMWCRAQNVKREEMTMITLSHLPSFIHGTTCRKVLDCASPLALCRGELSRPKRQRTAAVQNASAFTASTVLALIASCAFAAAAFGGVEQTVSDLIPKLAAQNVEDRYGPQMELQAVAAHASRPGAAAERAELSKVLAAKASDATVPQPARVWIVRQLEYIGAAEAVPALTALLAEQDAELKECARRALEKNPSPAASDTLRAALEKGGETAWRIGLIQSLGERGDKNSVELIKPYVKSNDTGTVACSALGKIATDGAITALWTAYDGSVPGAADGLVIAGNRLLAAHQAAQAEAAFRRLYLAGVPRPGAPAQSVNQPAAAFPVRRAALMGLAAANAKDVRQLIQADLQSKDPQLELAAVEATTVMCGKERVGEALAPLLPGLSPTAKVYVLRTLGPASEKQVVAAVDDPDEQVQLAALERLGQIGSAVAVPVVVKAASTDSSPMQKAAVAALARMPGRDAGPAIANAASQGEARTRATAIQALAARNDTSVLPALMKYAGESDSTVSHAAFAALGKLGGDSELEGLAKLALKGQTPGAGQVLQEVASRAHDKAAAAQRLLALTRGAEPQQLPMLFETLTILGGTEAMNAVAKYASGTNEQVKDAAIRALASWPDFGATQPLLVIAADPNTSRVHSVLAIQAIVRLVKASDKEPAAARVQAAQAAMNACNRDQEKKLVVSAFASVPDAQAAEAIKALLRDPNLKREAGLAGITLAEALSKKDKPAAQALAQAIKEANVSEDLNRKAEAMLIRN